MRTKRAIDLVPLPAFHSLLPVSVQQRLKASVGIGHTTEQHGPSFERVRAMDAAIAHAKTTTPQRFKPEPETPDEKE